jgi:hypothetical protein
MVYLYLSPDTDLPIREPDLLDVRKLRKDGEACAPGLLRANRQIYEEFIIHFYGTATFALYVETNELSFLGTPTYPYDPIFPRPLSYVRNLHIEIQLPPVIRIWSEEASKCTYQLVEHLSKHCPYLKVINFAFDIRVMDGHVTTNRMDWYVHEPHAFIVQHVRPSFEWAMLPFKGLHGIEMVSLNGSVWHKVPDTVPGTSDGSGRTSQDRLTEEADVYCRKLVNHFFK